MAGDIYWDKTILAMHMDDVGLTDLKGHAVTLLSAVRSAAQSKAGGYSAYFNGSSTLSIPTDPLFAFPAGTNFTLEFWIYLTATFISRIFMIGALGSGGLAIGANGSSVMTIEKNGIDRAVTGSTTPPLNTWSHVAAVRNGGTCTLYLNGVPIGSAANSYAFPAGAITIGTGLTGYLDDVRLTTGVARYTANFSGSLPVAPFLNAPQLSGTVKDASGNFAARAVNVYRRSDGILSSRVTSDGSTGVFAANAFDMTPHFAVCLPPTSAENALILDNLTPI